jgi:hypothetical protein
VEYSTSDGTALAGVDYVATSGTLTWMDGDISDKTFTVPIVDDLLQETDETVILTLTSPTGDAYLGTLRQTTLTISEGWTRWEANPVLGPSGAGMAWDDDEVGHPSVLGPDDGLAMYMMWYEGKDQATGTEQIGLCVSMDGVTWEKRGWPLLSPGGPGEWDESCISAPSACYDVSTGLFFLFYNGEDVAGNLQIGVATSSDGLIFQKSPSNPVLSPGAPGSWDAGGVGYVSVLKDGSSFRMWYTGADTLLPSGLLQIGTAVSPDGITWSRVPWNPVLSPDPLSCEEPGVAFPGVIDDGIAHRMIYTAGVSPVSSSRTGIGYAFSSDGGMTWRKYQDAFGLPAPILEVGAPGEWDDGGILGADWSSISPPRMWYEAENSAGESRIGLATHP